MARRYVYAAVGGLADQIRTLAPLATVTEIVGAIAVVVPDVAVGAYDANQPASAILTEDVPEGSDHGLTYVVPAHLIVNLNAASDANNAGALAVAASAIKNETRSRVLVVGDAEVV